MQNKPSIDDVLEKKVRIKRMDTQWVIHVYNSHFYGKIKQHIQRDKTSFKKTKNQISKKV